MVVELGREVVGIYGAWVAYECTGNIVVVYGYGFGEV